MREDNIEEIIHPQHLCYEWFHEGNIHCCKCLSGQWERMKHFCICSNSSKDTMFKCSYKVQIKTLYEQHHKEGDGSWTYVPVVNLYGGDRYLGREKQSLCTRWFSLLLTWHCSKFTLGYSDQRLKCQFFFLFRSVMNPDENLENCAFEKKFRI